jgi:hypothetical protein
MTRSCEKHKYELIAYLKIYFSFGKKSKRTHQFRYKVICLDKSRTCYLTMACNLQSHEGDF